MNKYLLDTSTCSLLMKDNPKVKGRLNSLTESDYPFTCSIVKGEILFGIARLPAGKRRQNLQQKANELFAVIPCEPISESVSAPPSCFGSDFPSGALACVSASTFGSGKFENKDLMRMPA